MRIVPAPAAMQRAIAIAASVAFLAGIGGLFMACAAVTVVNARSMAAMAGLPMSGGWRLSMSWMPQCGRDELDNARAFLGMWTAMMMAMMSPAFAPALWRYRRTLAQRGGVYPGLCAAVAGLGYALVWTVLGAALFLSGTAIARWLIQRPVLAHAEPWVAAVVVIGAGVLQRSDWKAGQLVHCQKPLNAGALPGFRRAWREGLRLGRHCCLACAGLTLALLVVGMMDLRAMVLATLIIAGERLMPEGVRVARLSGLMLIVCGGLGWLRIVVTG